MYNLGDYVVCPGHGVGQILSIESREHNGEVSEYYNIRIVANGMKIMVPKDAKEAIRGLVSNNEIEGVYELLHDHDVKIDTSTWNRRHREYLAKVKTGSLLEIADVLRALLLLKSSKKLSFGEKKMLDQCKELIVSEISLSTGDAEKEIAVKIDEIFP